MIPQVVILLQKQVRGWMCRQRYKKMKAALYIMQYYRRYKLRSYVNELAKKFKNAKNMRDYGKNIQWPQPPKVGLTAEPLLRQLFNNWRAYMILKKYPRSEWPQMRLQIIAASAIKGRRKHWGQERKWYGDYLANTHENTSYSTYNASVKNMKNSDGFRFVMFSAFIKKFNRFNKTAERALVVTDNAIYKIDGPKNKFKNMKRSIMIKDVSFFFMFKKKIIEKIKIFI